MTKIVIGCGLRCNVSSHHHENVVRVGLVAGFRTQNVICVTGSPSKPTRVLLPSPLQRQLCGSEVSGPLCRSCPVTWGGCWLAPKKQVRQRPEKVWNPGPLKDEAVAPASCSIEVAISSSREQSLRGQFNVPAGRVVSSNPLEARLYVCMYVRVLCARL